MSQVDLVTDLKASLQSAADAFRDADDGAFKRHLTHAALDFARVRPRTLLGTLTLVAEQADYAVPADFQDVKSPLWGVGVTGSGASIKPWDKAWPGRLPQVRVVEIGGDLQLHLDPPPTEQQIAVLGATFKYYYFAAHAIGTEAADTTIKAGDRGLLLLRAQAEAMKELAVRNTAKPVQMRDGLNFQTRNGTPSALFERLMSLFDEAARH